MKLTNIAIIISKAPNITWDTVDFAVVDDVTDKITYSNEGKEAAVIKITYKDKKKEEVLQMKKVKVPA